MLYYELLACIFFQSQEHSPLQQQYPEALHQQPIPIRKASRAEHVGQRHLPEVPQVIRGGKCQSQNPLDLQE